MNELLPHNGRIRKLWMAENDIYRDHLLRLDPQSRRSRFGGGVSDQFIENYGAVANSLDSVIHSFFVDGILRGTGELRPLGADFQQEAETAFSIEAPWQSHGVGTALLDRTLLAARNRGFKLLHMACLAENRRHATARAQVRCRADVRFRQRAGRSRGDAPNPALGLREFVADTTGFATALLDVQSR
jgi:GNAT superfamily N-acetyltransferase